MLLNLKLQNFRSYKNNTFDFYPKANIIVGPNAIGKTNLIEAILLLHSGSSYRAKDVDLISFNKPWARLDGKTSSSLRTIKIQRDQTPSKSLEINGKSYKKLSADIKLPVVIFEPNHLQLLNGSPEGRRSYLDTLIKQLSKDYSVTLGKYNRALIQRNSLLKTHIRPKNNQLFPWNIRISQLAGQIVKYRQETIDNINTRLPAIYASLSKDGVVTALRYHPQLPAIGYESAYLKKLESNIDEDLRIGFTAYGPHRDDFVFVYNNRPSGTYASRGELRTAVLALKITELDTLEKQADNRPVILLDDVYSELDSTRRKALTGYLKDHQSFITATDADLVIKQLKGNNKLIKL